MNINLHMTFKKGDQKVTKITVVTFRHKITVKATSDFCSFLVRSDQKVTKIRCRSDQNFWSGLINNYKKPLQL